MRQLAMLELAMGQLAFSKACPSDESGNTTCAILSIFFARYSELAGSFVPDVLPPLRRDEAGLDDTRHRHD